jgi:hypothetical protein
MLRPCSINDVSTVRYDNPLAGRTHFQAMKETASTIVGCSIWSVSQQSFFYCLQDKPNYLDDLLSGEHTPRHSVRSFAMRVGAQITLTIDGVIGDTRVLFDTSHQLVQEVRRNEELEVGLKIRASFSNRRNLFLNSEAPHLLVDVTTGRSPSVSGVLATGSVNSRLTVNGQVSELVHLGKLLVDDRSLLRRRLTGPGKRSQFISAEFGEQRRDIGEPLKTLQDRSSVASLEIKKTGSTYSLGSPHNSNASLPCVTRQVRFMRTLMGKAPVNLQEHRS